MEIREDFLMRFASLIHLTNTQKRKWNAIEEFEVNFDEKNSNLF